MHYNTLCEVSYIECDMLLLSELYGGLSSLGILFMISSVTFYHNEMITESRLALSDREVASFTLLKTEGNLFKLRRQLTFPLPTKETTLLRLIFTKQPGYCDEVIQSRILRDLGQCFLLPTMLFA